MQKLLLRVEAIKDMFTTEELERITDCANIYLTSNNKEERESMYDVVLYTVEKAEEEFHSMKKYIKELVKDI